MAATQSNQVPEAIELPDLTSEGDQTMQAARGQSQSVPVDTLLTDRDDQEAAVTKLYGILIIQGVDERTLTQNDLMRGVLLGQSRDDLKDLSKAENKALDAEIEQPCRLTDILTLDFWALPAGLECMPRTFWTILTACSVGALLQGMVQESIVGANLAWPTDFNFTVQAPSSFEADPSVPELQFWSYWHRDIFALINMIPYFAACVSGPLISDPMADVFGRRMVLIFAALCSLAGSVCAFYGNRWELLFVSRLVQGIGIGAKSAVIPVILSEISPTLMRGRILVLWQTFVAIGILLGALAIVALQSFTWHVQIAIPAFPAIVLGVLGFLIEETPQWHAKNRDFALAYRVLCQIRRTRLQALRELFDLYGQVTVYADQRKEAVRDANQNYRLSYTERRGRYWRKLRDIFEPRHFNALVCSSMVMAAQQFSGINLQAFLSTNVFRDAGLGIETILGINCGFGALNAIVSALTFYFIDMKNGRRRLLLSSLLVMFPLLISIGYALDEGNPGTIGTLVFLHTIAYSFGAGVIPFLYSAEVFQIDYRELGMALSSSVNFALAGAFAMAASVGLNSVQGVGAPHVSEFPVLGFFGAFDGASFILIWLALRSPQHATSLRMMDRWIDPPFGQFSRYQVAKMQLRLKKFFGREDIASIRPAPNVPNALKQEFPTWFNNRSRPQESI